MWLECEHIDLFAGNFDKEEDSYSDQYGLRSHDRMVASHMKVIKK